MRSWVWEPGLPDRLTLTLINRKQIRPEHFDERPGGSATLTAEGRKLVLAAYQKRKQEEVGHPLVKEPLPIGLPGDRVAPMMRAAGIPFAAANLCGHHKTSPALYLKVVERLLETAGGIVNDRLPLEEPAQSRPN